MDTPLSTTAVAPPVPEPGTVALHRQGASAGALLAVLGIVYGDIGTSPLYALKTSLMHFDGVGITQFDVLGILSLVFWSLILIVTVKYVLVIMRADNRGEGGILALMALAQRVGPQGRMRNILGLIGIGGACLFFGDGLITPAISVLSAVEGLEISSPGLAQYILPISTVVIVMLFAVQSRGTGSVGRVFGPVMAVWFLAIGALGLVQVVRHPAVLFALSPSYSVEFCAHYGWMAFVVLGSVVLAVTGAEALYADMGHFGARPIRLAWLFFVLPSLVLNYFGQGAMMIHDPATLSNPFYLLAPDWLQLPLVVLATAATVIASQALISGAYSIARQCMQLGFMPRMTIRHTSMVEAGQIYVPQINLALMVGVLILVFAFRSSDALASAYGIAVTGTFMCTAILAMVVFRGQFGWSRSLSIAVFGGFLLLDTIFFAANALKIPQGGWVPLLFGLLLLALMTTWHEGRALLLARLRQDSLSLASFLKRLPQSRTIRVPGMAIFLTGNPGFGAGRAAAQPQAQQGAARAGTVRDGEHAGHPAGGCGEAGERGGAGARNLSGDAALRLHGEPEHPARDGGAAGAGRAVRSDAGELLPGPRGAGAGAGAEAARSGAWACF